MPARGRAEKDTVMKVGVGGRRGGARGPDDFTV